MPDLDRQLVIFDWDGTLMDSAARIVGTVQAAIAATDLPHRSAAQIRGIIGLGLGEAVARLFPQAPETARARLVRHYRQGFAHTMDAAGAGLFPGAAETLARLERAGHLLAVATGKSRRGLAHELEQTGVGGHFVATRTVDECPSKPHPAMVEELIADCGASAAGTLVVGDTLFDLEMASNAGVRALGVAWGAHPAEDLLQARPLDVIREFGDIDRWLGPGGR